MIDLASFDFRYNLIEFDKNNAFLIAANEDLNQNNEGYQVIYWSKEIRKSVPLLFESPAAGQTDAYVFM